MKLHLSSVRSCHGERSKKKREREEAECLNIGIDVYVFRIWEEIIVQTVFIH